MTPMMTRRQLLYSSACGALLLASCRSEPPAQQPTPAATAAPSPTPTPAVTSAAPVINSPTVDLMVKIGQMFMVGFRGLTVDTQTPVMQDIVSRHLGGVVLFDYDVPNAEFVRNIASPQQLRALTTALQAAAPIPLLVATDQEGGKVARLNERFGFPATLSAAALGQLDDVHATYAQASRMAQTLAEAGINHNLAPVVDLNVNPDSPAIGAYERSFGDDPQKVVAQATAFIEAHRDHNILCTLKHFPGHGSARADSHRGFVDVSESWSPVELEPFAALIQAGLADSVMTAHIFNRRWDQSDPATLSPAVIDGLLRGELGYNGVVISDDLQMGAIRNEYGFEEAIRKVIEAGVDIIAIANNSVYDEAVMAKGVAIVKQLVADQIITAERIEQSYQRIMQLKSRLNRQ